MTDREINKLLRRRFGTAGWTLLIYYGVMNIMVILAMFVQGMADALGAVRAGVMPDPAKITAGIAGNAWGYLYAAAVGLVILIGWKGLPYLGKEMWLPRRKMDSVSFLAVLCVFVSTQLVFSVLTDLLDSLLSPLGVDITASVEAATMQRTSVSLLLYGCLIAPLTEEVLFRGLIQGMFRSYGKRFGILTSAFLFGMYHGNLVQTPYAFAVGLVLGYVAEEYSLGWCVLLHMFNNLVLGSLLPGLAGLLPGVSGELLQGGILLAFSVAALGVLIANIPKIREYREANRMDGRCLTCFFSNAGTIFFIVVFAANMVLMLSLGASG